MTSYSGFWGELKKPFFVMAPMADVTDAAFRRMFAKYGKPDVTWTEFVSADGLCHPEGRLAMLGDLGYTEAERPIVAQVFTAHPDKMRESARIILGLGFDGIDINMGCPDKNVMKQGAGAKLMQDPALARSLVAAAKEGVEGKIPVSVKTRIGFNKDELDVWLPELLSERPAAITVHARTKKEMSLVPARWEYVAQAVELARGTGVLIIGNGDVRSMEEARQRVAETGCDGVMIGRGLFGNPWFFSEQEVSLDERLRALIEHTELYESLFSGQKSFEIMKKHYKAYAHGFDGAHGLRAALMECHDAPSVRERVEDFLLHRAAAAIDKPPLD
ncbi:MAG: tRNA-dihydrouridine synthase [Candidatus Moranbacteria bacterium]|nr:tRNA-dihydrouridine synthase [Candidatus Moranbacteria bacterium]MBP6034061.1 tRNA-dihydrouridine synthase [Candidatus Moranbacteria bacterium]MBP7696108.1 tRNA-dihydrouridine synthase [Candidatus Moranbacteria bacterium]